jgi:hypothetical protein
VRGANDSAYTIEDHQSAVRRSAADAARRLRQTLWASSSPGRQWRPTARGSFDWGGAWCQPQSCGGATPWSWSAPADQQCWPQGSVAQWQQHNSGGYKALCCWRTKYCVNPSRDRRNRGVAGRNSASGASKSGSAAALDPVAQHWEQLPSGNSNTQQPAVRAHAHNPFK